MIVWAVRKGGGGKGGEREGGRRWRRYGWSWPFGGGGGT